MDYIQSLSIEHRDGGIDVIDSSFVGLAAGSHISIDKDDTTKNTFYIRASGDISSDDPYTVDKYNAVISGNIGLNAPYQFSGAPYYYSTIAGVSPIDTHSFLLSKSCVHIGLFENGINPSLDNNNIATDGSLDITDVCPPCVDCSDYEDIHMYMDAIANRATDRKQQLYTDSVDITRQNNVMRLYKQMLLYWNHMVQLTSWRCSALADGSEVNAACMFTNYFAAPIPAGFTLSIAVTDMPGGVLAQLIDTVLPSGWSDADSTIDDGGNLIQEPRTITITHSGNDTAVIFDPDIPPDPNDPDDQGYTAPYRFVGDTLMLAGIFCAVIVAGSEEFTVSGVGIDTLTDPVELSGAPTISITTNRELLVGESIRLYTGGISYGYVGNTKTATALFSNNLNNLGYVSFPENKLLRTNNMVVVEGEA